MDRDGTDPIQRCFDESYGRLVRQLYGVCGDRSEAEDVVAEAFVRAVSKRRTFERLDSPEAWLRTVAVNIARSRHRRKVLGEKLMFRSHDEEVGPRDAVDDRGDRLDVVAALRRLPQEQREALALHYLADLPVAEVAETVGAPVGTVKARLSRGRTALAAVMTADEPELAVDAPPYDDIERRGNRRRAVRQGVTAGTAGLAVVLVIVFAQSVVRGGGDAAPPPIAPSPTRADDGTAAPSKVVDVVSGQNPDVRAVVSQAGREWTIGLSDAEGTWTEMDVPAGTSVAPGPAGLFVVSEGRNGDSLELVDARAQVIPLSTSSEVLPVGEEEAPVAITTAAGPALVAVNPATGTAHPVRPEIGDELMWDASSHGGRLAVLTKGESTSTYHWSDDGGESWHEQPLDDAGWSSIVPTGADEEHVVVEGGDGATGFPFLAVHTMPAAGGGFDRVAREGEFAEYLGGYVGSGELVVAAEIGGRQPAQASGTFAFTEGELRQLVDFPASEIVSVEPDGTIWMADSVGLLRSVDGGRTWESFSHDPDEEPTHPEAGDPAGEIVDGSDATLDDAALTTDGGLATMWRAGTRGPRGDPMGLAVSGDDFATRTTFSLPFAGDVTAAGDYVIVRDQAMKDLWVVDAAGERRPVEVTGGEGTVASEEFAVSTAGGLVALDPETATAHRVPDEGLYDVVSYGGRLSALSSVIDGRGNVEATYHWSDDGGASWSETTFDAGQTGLPEIVPTAAGTDHVVLLRADGATIGPLISVLTMAPGDEAFIETPYDGEQASTAGAWVRDGELWLLADLWGDGTGPPRESGLYRWADGSLEPVESDPEVTENQERSLLDVADDGRTLLVGVGHQLFRSTDGGERWVELRAR